VSALEAPRALDRGSLIVVVDETIAASALRAPGFVGLQFHATLGAPGQSHVIQYDLPVSYIGPASTVPPALRHVHTFPPGAATHEHTIDHRVTVNHQLELQVYMTA